MAYKIGDVYEIYLTDELKGHFWHVANDKSQIASQVIYVFKEKFPLNVTLKPEEVVRGEVDFCTHVFRLFGTKIGTWKKIGHIPFEGTVEQIFRSTQDMGNPEIKVSEKWSIWRVGEDRHYVGKLEGEYRNSEPGDVMPPNEIVARMITGKFQYWDHGF